MNDIWEGRLYNERKYKMIRAIKNIEMRNSEQMGTAKEKAAQARMKIKAQFVFLISLISC